MATFTGTAGNDSLAGTTGADTLEGLAGNDTYIVNHCDDVVTENPGEGIDIVKSTVTFALDASTENLTLTGSAAINGTGNDLDNILIGNNGGNRLITGLGQDTVNAGGGNDFVEVGGDLGGSDKIDGGAGIDKLILDGDYSAGLVFGLTTALNFERFSLADGNSYDLTLADVTNATGLFVDGSKLTGANTLMLDGSAETSSALTAIGGAGDDTIIGGGGNDTLTGGVGADVLTGNGGIDTVRYDTSSAGVTVDLNSGAGSGGDAAGDQLSGIENLVGSIHDDHFTGDDLNNNIAAGAGHDTLIAGLGIDTLSGEDGNDYFTLDGNFTTADRVYGGDGNDTLELNGNYAAGLSFGSTVTGIENILLGGGFSYKLTLSATTAIGGLLVDGSALGVGENLILLGGSAGAIEVIGGGGNDSIVGGAGNDTLSGGTGTDTLLGGAGANLFAVGGSLDATDKIVGGSGSDTLQFDGDYSGGVLFTATSVTAIETFKFAAGNSYDLTLNNATNAKLLTIDGSALGAADSLIVDGAAETSNAFVFFGGAGDDTMTGGGGADTFHGSLGADALTGGNGIDLVDYSGSADAIGIDLQNNGNVGGDAQDDTLVGIEHVIGTGQDDTLLGSNQSNKIVGGQGSDFISGGNGGADTLLGDDGSETFWMGASLDSKDQLDGGSDDDYLYLSGNYAAGVVFGATTMINVEAISVLAGNDYKLTLSAMTNAGGMDIDASSLGASDTLFLTASAEKVDWFIITGGLGNDTIIAGGGEDWIWGGGGNDSIVGNNGADSLFGEAGADTLSGGGGKDTIVGGAAADKIDGGSDLDYASYVGSAAVNVNLTTNVNAGGDAAGDTLIGIENLIGSSNNDTLTGNTAANVIEGGAGADSIDGAAGFDMVSYATSGPVTVDLSLGGAQGGANHAAGDTLTGIEGVIGSDFADMLTSGATGKKLMGGAGDDTLVAGAGVDTLMGEDGDDSFVLTDKLTGSDRVYGGDGFDTAILDGNYSAGLTLSSSVLQGIEWLELTANGNDYKLTVGTTGGFGMTVDGGGLGSNTLYFKASGSGGVAVIGADGNDTMIGGTGADYFTGAAGADVMTGSGGVDTVDYATSASGVTINLATTAAQTSGGDAAGDKLSGIENAVGSGLDDTLMGTSANNQLDGGDGNDLLVGVGGLDTLIGGIGVDTADFSGLSAAIVIDLENSQNNGGAAEGAVLVTIENVIGTKFDDRLKGDDTVNSLAGGEGDDTLIGGEDADTLDGGAGVDTADYSASDAAVNVDLAGGAASGGHAAGDTLIDVENLIGSGGDDQLLGDSNSNSIVGNGGNDTVGAGDDGLDTLSGDAGDDVLLVGAGMTAADRADGGADDDTVVFDGDYSVQLILGATTIVNVETIEFVDGNSYNLKLNNATNLEGLTVDATMLTAGSELILDGSTETTAALTAMGGAGDDVIIGGGGMDTIEGGAGADTLVGGTKTDTLTYENSASAVTVNLLTNVNTGGDAQGDSVTGFENLIGSDHDDDLTGDALNNLIDGGAGADTMDGGAGIDTVTYENSKAVTVDLSTDINTGGDAEGDSLTNIEYVIGSDKADSITGNGQANKLEGGAGDDTLVAGGAGNDTMLGGAGDDVIDMDGFLNADDKIDGGFDLDNPETNKLILNGDYSTQLIFKSTTVVNIDTIELEDGFTYNLKLANATNAEELTVDASKLTAGNVLILDGAAETTAALIAIGGAGNDRIIGGGGMDTLTGGDGADALYGGNGIDTAKYKDSTVEVNVDLLTNGNTGGTAQGDSLVGIENVVGSDFDDTLTGNAVNNVLEGGEGADIIDGGLGLDLASYEGSKAAVTVDLSIAGAQVSTGDAADDTLIGIEGVIGSDHDDTLIGNGSSNKLVGGKGADTLIADCGNDTIEGGNGADEIVFNAEFTALDRVDGGDGTDTLVLDGNYSAGIKLGATTLVNVEVVTLAAGNSYKFTLHDDNNTDTLFFDGSALANDETVVINGAAETASQLKVFGGLGNDTITGGGGGDILTGNGGNDLLTGNGGADSLNGGDGNDKMYGGAGGDRFTAGTGIDTMIGGDGADTFVLEGNMTGADRIDGGAGFDELTLEGDYSGGLLFSAATMVGVEQITVADGFSYKLILDNATNAAGLIVDASGLGAGNSLDLDAGKETTASLTATGGDGDDRIIAGAGNDTIVGGAGADTLAGGAGKDTLSYAASAAGVTVNLVTNLNTGGDAQGDVLSGFEVIIGSDWDDDITADGADNLLNGGLGWDTLDGGQGIDTVDYSSYVNPVPDSFVGMYIDLNLGFSNDGVDIDLLSDIENVVGTAYDDAIIGDGANNHITAGSGFDYVEGGAGNDTLLGGDGQDILMGGTGADSLVGGNRYDWADYSLSTAAVTVNLTLTGAQSSGGEASGDTLAGIEALTGSEFADKLTGNGIKNYLEGLGGADRLDGGDGFDYAEYGQSDAAVTVNLNNAGAQASGGDAAGDVLINIEGVGGSQYDDRLIGNSSRNGLYGEGGTDTLTGGGESDLFGFNSSTLGTVDVITDFTVGKVSEGGDILHIGNILEDFDATGEINDILRITFSGGQTILQIDKDGDTGGANFIDLAVLVGVSSGISIDTLVNNGQIDTVPVTD